MYQTFCLEGKSIEEFISKFKAWQDELQLMSKQLAGEDFCYLLMSALPELWEPFIKAALGNDYKDPEKLMSKIAEEDNRLQARHGTDETTLAFKGKTGGRNSGKAPVECFNCGKKGHIAKFCRSKGKKKENGMARSFPIMAEALLNEKDENLWLGNTGASVHVAFDKSFFRNYTTLDIKQIKGAGSAKVAGTGSIDVITHVSNKTYEITLKDVLHVPSMKFNLISLGRMEKAGLSFNLTDGQMDGIEKLSRTVRLINREPPKTGLQSLPGKLLRVNAEE
jgi:hypothetical protein